MGIDSTWTKVLIACSISTRCQCKGEECRQMHCSSEFFSSLKKGEGCRDGVMELLEVSELCALKWETSAEFLQKHVFLVSTACVF